MINLRTAAQQALEALQAYGSHAPNCDYLVLLTSLPPQRKPCSCGLGANITALRAALAEPIKTAMTRDDIIRMARQAGGADITSHGWTSWVGTHSTEFLERFAALVAAHEREQCKEWIATWVEDWCEGWSAKKIAHCIRGDGNDIEKPNKYVTREEPL